MSATLVDGITPYRAEQLRRVRNVVLAGLAAFRAKVYLFGSYARGTPRQWSDIDVAVDPLEPLPLGLQSEIRESLEESSIPFEIDLVDMRDVSPTMRRAIEKEGVAWRT